MAGYHRAQSSTLLVLLLSTCAMVCSGIQTNWTYWGGDLNNRRFSDHSCLDFSVGGMQKKWTFYTASTVMPTPSVCGGAVYFVDNAVTIYKLSLDGKLQWSVKANSLIPGQSVGIRSSPIMSDDCKTVYLTTQWTKGSWLIALDTATGAKKYATNFDPQPLSRITQSGVLWAGVIYIGASSMTEGSLTSGTTFRGSMFALNANDGSVKWQTYMCPAGGYTGCAIWGSSPSIDVRRNQVCIGTGNNYEVPGSVAQCVKNAGMDFTKQRACSDPNNLVDSAVCLDMGSGKVNWARNLNGIDMYLPGAYMGLDQDFAQGLITIHKGNPAQDVLIGTSKSGMPIAFNPKTGQTVWKSGVIAQGGFAMYGSCSNNKLYCMGLFWYSSKQGVVSCLDALTGAKKFTWTTQAGGVYGPLTCTQNYVFVPLFDGPGSLVVLNINTGQQVASVATGTTLFTGPAIVNGVAYVGSGYTANGGQPNKVIHAFKLPLKGTC